RVAAAGAAVIVRRGYNGARPAAWTSIKRSTPIHCGLRLRPNPRVEAGPRVRGGAAGGPRGAGGPRAGAALLAAALLPGGLELRGAPGLG
nr:hypothetical protein [Tanacetum cinerariifolium]